MTTYARKVLVLALAVGMLAGPLQAAGKTITIKGSDTMVIIVQRWAEKFMQSHPGIVIQVTGGGSGTGIAALINGSTDIADSSRPMKPEEKDLVKQKRGQEVSEIPVAQDGLAIYVNDSNPMTKISLAQVNAVYTGKQTKWEALGANSGQIIAYGRENNSGTYAYFKEHVLKNEDFAAEVMSLPGTAAVINAVRKDPQAIGYGGIAYAKGIKALAVSKDGGPAVEPSMENVLSGKYPISRSLYFYTAGSAEGQAKAFISWVLGSEGQKICEAVGYYPLAKARKAKAGKTTDQ